ncbi:MAG TPA: D-tyrosyl-tRNA(Tyr) deacylase [Candidatus Latescibacteria bacterium]|nr:D-tyrosyl-tRNA(Tyr) deacylase [Candidatus Latescibacterota bacterium]
MRVVFQRVKKARVTVGDRVVAEIGAGAVLLVGIRRDDTSKDVEFLARKCLGLRVFEDGEGKMNLSVSDIHGDLLAVSQFTLYGDTRKGRRPSFTDAAPPGKAHQLYEEFVSVLRTSGLRIQKGSFGELMLVEIHNDGPVTLIIDSR